MNTADPLENIESKYHKRLRADILKSVKLRMESLTTEELFALTKELKKAVERVSNKSAAEL